MAVRQDPPGPRPGALKTELRSDKMADPKGLAPSAFPQTTGCSGYLSYGSKKWWEVLVMLQSSLPTVVFDTGFTDRQPEHLPVGSGGGNHTHLKEFMRLLSVL